jgi:hypothetical protein
MPISPTVAQLGDLGFGGGLLGQQTEAELEEERRRKKLGLSHEMSEEQTSVTLAPPAPATPPQLDDVAKLSPAQAAHWVDELRVQWLDKLLSGGDPATLALFNALVAKRSEGDVVDEVLGADMPLPPEGGANDHGLSRRDVKSGIVGLLDDGLSTGAVGELLHNRAVCSPEDYRVLSREFSARCLNNPEWKAALLAGNPEAKRQLLAWGTLKITSRPLPESPKFDVIKYK